MSYERIYADTQGIAALPGFGQNLIRRRGIARRGPVHRGQAMMRRNLVRNPARSSGAFYSLPAEMVEGLGFSLNPFKLLKKIIKPAISIASGLIPGGPLLRTAAGFAVGSLMSRHSTPSAPRTSTFFGRAARLHQRLVSVAPVPAASSPITVSSDATSAPVPQSMMSSPSSGGGGGGGGAVSASADQETETPAKPAAGMGAAPLIIGGLVLLAAIRRKH